MIDPHVPVGADAVIVRVGEIATKSEQVRYRMQSDLGENLRALLADRGIDGTVEHRRHRLWIWTDEPTAATAAATDAMGVVSASPARSIDPDLASIERALAKAAREHYDRGTFAVRANRRGELPFTSHDLEREGGAAVWSAVEDRFEPAVDLDDPDRRFHVDVEPDRAFVFLETLPGPGGLPLGCQQPLVALVSGGIDSPVAAHEVMRRGAPIVPVYFDLGEFGGPDHLARAVEATERLAAYAPRRIDTLWRVPAGETCRRLVDGMEQGRMLSLRRFMYRAAGELAAEWDAAGIVTGESIGQKSSQTTRNLGVTDRTTEYPIHRPLLTVDKNEITERAKAIGTFSTATIDAGCNRIAPDQVETNASLERLRAVEPEDLFEQAREAAAAAEPIPIDR